MTETKLRPEDVVELKNLMKTPKPDLASIVLVSRLRLEVAQEDQHKLERQNGTLSAENDALTDRASRLLNQLHIFNKELVDMCQVAHPDHDFLIHNSVYDPAPPSGYSLVKDSDDLTTDQRIIWFLWKEINEIRDRYDDQLSKNASKAQFHMGDECLRRR